MDYCNCIHLLVVLFMFTGAAAYSGVGDDDIIDHCCDLGRTWAIQSQEICGPYPESYLASMLYGPEETLLCSALVDICCVQSRRERQCSAGREAALVLGACDGLHLYQANEDAKECCNCCHLGIIANQIGGACHVPHQLSLSLTCAESFTECCLGKAPVSPSDPEAGLSAPSPTANPRRSNSNDGKTRDTSRPSPPGFTTTTTTTTEAALLDVCEHFKGELCAHICISTTDSYRCECSDGYRLQSDGKTCSKIFDDDVGSIDDGAVDGGLELENTDRQLPDGALDHRTTPSPVTLPPGRCRHGYAWNRITYQCEDIDECILDLHNCDPNQSCVNGDGDFRCLDELEDSDIYDDYYPETEPPPPPTPPPPTNTTASSTTTSITRSTIRTTTTTTRPIMRSRTREDRPIFRPIFTARPSTISGTIGRSLTPTTRGSVLDDPRVNEAIQCLFGYTPDAAGNCVDVNECASRVHNCRLPNQHCVNTPGSYRCQCEQGFTLNRETNFCEDVDECSDQSICSVDQKCENTLGSYLCTCVSGFTMDARTQQCTDINECRLEPSICGTGHQCQNVPGSYRCTKKPLTCSHGYQPNHSGTQCVDIDECSLADSCSAERGQVCRNTPGSFHCSCETGFALDSRTQRCSDVNECLQSPSVCSSSEECENAIGSYRCNRKILVCETGFKLNNDETRCIDVDECSDRGNICGGINENCANTVGSYLCNCIAGYRRNATAGLCEDVDECQSREFTCLRGQVCVNTPGSFECRCAAGFTMDSRSNRCTDINECEQSTKVCNDNELCENTQGSFRCLQRSISCPPGFNPNPSGRQCVDVDECRLRTDNCGVAYACYNTPGSFRCVLRQCSRGQRLDHETGQCIPVVCARGMRIDHAGTCTDINECVERPTICRPHQTCRNTIGSYQCHSSINCGSGYELNEDTGRCDDIDECQRGTHRCQGNLIQCLNRPGTYVCQCPEGYNLDHQRQSCEDVDECRLYRGHICSQNAECENSPGSFRCICKEGFELTEDKRSCRDVDECLQPRLCQHSCHNTWGSFHCSCNSGYQLSPADSRSCSDIDECAVWSQRGTVLCQGICENNQGSYQCTCPSGYQMGTDGRVCRDVDECAGSSSTCNRADDVCINTRGSHKCENVVCPKGFSKLTNSNRNSHAVRCQRKSFTCPQGDADCLYAPISYSVNFIAIPGRLIRVPIDLFTMRGPVTANRRLQFELQVVSAQDPRTGAVRANRAFFNLNQVRENEVVVQLVHEIHGAQDIQLQLNMNVYSRDGEESADEIFFGTAVAKIFIYITEDPW